MIIGFDKLDRQFEDLAKKYKEEPVIETGYTAAYALYVHENMEMKLKGFSRDPRIRRIEQGGDASKARPRSRKREPHGKFWDPQGRGQSKFLEAPAKSERQTMGNIVVNALRKGTTLADALLLAGLHLQRTSQPLVPVDEGELKASAFTRQAK